MYNKNILYDENKQFILLLFKERKYNLSSLLLVVSLVTTFSTYGTEQGQNA